MIKAMKVIKAISAKSAKVPKVPRVPKVLKVPKVQKLPKYSIADQGTLSRPKHYDIAVLPVTSISDAYIHSNIE